MSRGIQAKDIQTILGINKHEYYYLQKKLQIPGDIQESWGTETVRRYSLMRFSEFIMAQQLYAMGFRHGVIQKFINDFRSKMQQAANRG